MFVTRALAGHHARMSGQTCQHPISVPLPLLVLQVAICLAQSRFYFGHLCKAQQVAFVGHFFFAVQPRPKPYTLPAATFVVHVLAEPQKVAVHLLAAMFWPPSKISAGCCPFRFYVGYPCWAQQLAFLGHRFLRSSVSPHTHRLQPCSWLKHLPATMQGCLAKHAGARFRCHCHCLFCRLPYVWRLKVTHQVAAHLPAARSLLPSPGFILDTCVGHSSYHLLAAGFFAVQPRPKP
jgi:hypothetical protein